MNQHEKYVIRAKQVHDIEFASYAL